MAIIQSKKDNLAATKLAAKTQMDDKEDFKELLEDNQTKKVGFFASTLQELRKAQWPSFGYVLRWSLVIVVFTSLFASVFGYFDYAFEGGLEFINCTSETSRGQNPGECFKEEIAERLLFQK